MKMRVMPLEERIVLDAAGLDASDHDKDQTDARTHLLQDDSSAPKDPAAGDSTSSEKNDSAEDSVNVLLVSSHLQGAEDLAAAATDQVLTVLFDGESGSTDKILDQIRDALNGRKADNIALATHSAGVGAFDLTGDLDVSAESLVANTQLGDFFKDLSSLLDSDGRLDLMACNLAASDEGQSLLHELSDLTGHEVAASDDPTGNVSYGDWILENTSLDSTASIDLAATYFVWDRLEDWDGRLATIYYVTSGAGAGGDGKNWGAAFHDLQKAFTTAQAGDQIWVAQGTYKPTETGTDVRTSTFTMKAAVEVYGGFVGNEGNLGQRADFSVDSDFTGKIGLVSPTDDVSAITNGRLTYISGDIGTGGDYSDNCYTVINGAADAKLDGFIIFGGNGFGEKTTTSGGGMINDKIDNLIVANCTFLNNQAKVGGGVYNVQVGSGTVFEDCVFSNNLATSGGGGVANTDGTAAQFKSGDSGAGVIFQGNVGDSVDEVLTPGNVNYNQTGTGGGAYNVASTAVFADGVFFGNTAAKGGGLASNTSSTVVQDSEFYSNTAVKTPTGSDSDGGACGGAIYSYVDGSVAGTLKNDEYLRVSIHDNTSHNGGGMATWRTSPTLTEVNFYHNSATGVVNPATGIFYDYTGLGGGMFNYDATPKIYDSSFWDNGLGAGGGNTADLDGGGMYNLSASDLTYSCRPVVVNTVFQNNTAGGDGGGICEVFSRSVYDSCVLADNIATGNGGGICVEAYRTGATMINSVIYRNTAADGGAVYVVNAATAELWNCTITQNSSGVRTGGGYDTAIDVFNSIIWQNGAYEVNEANNTAITLTYCDLSSAVPDKIDNYNTLYVDPLFRNANNAIGSDGIWRTVDDGLQIQQTALWDLADAYNPPDVADRDGDGSTSDPAPFDVMGFDRYRHDLVDCGAYEKYKVIFVDDTALGDQTGSDWFNAYTDLSQALAYAQSQIGLSGEVDSVWVAEGAYTPSVDKNGVVPHDTRDCTFALYDNLELFGGFVSGQNRPDLRDIDNHVSLLSGDINGDDAGGFSNRVDNAYHVVIGAADVLLSGFTITGGSAVTSGGSNPGAEGGGGLYVKNGKGMVVRDCTFVANQALRGGAIYYEDDAPLYSTDVADGLLIVNCMFSGNQAYDWGGAVYIPSGSLFVCNTVFTGNDGGGWGGAISNYSDKDSYLYLVNSAFIGNHAQSGGALELGAVSGRDEYSANVINCTFTGNRAVRGGVVTMFPNVDAKFTSCLFWANQADDAAYKNFYAQDNLVFYDNAGDYNQFHGLRDSAVLLQATLLEDGIPAWSHIENHGGTPDQNLLDLKYDYIQNTVTVGWIENGRWVDKDNMDSPVAFYNPLTGLTTIICNPFTGSEYEELKDGTLYSHWLTDQTSWENNVFVGLYLEVDTLSKNSSNEARQFYIVGNTANTITVLGDVTGLVQRGDSFTVNDPHLVNGSQAKDAGHANLTQDGQYISNRELLDDFADVDDDGNVFEIIPFDVTGERRQTTVGERHDIGAYETAIERPKRPPAVFVLTKPDGSTVVNHTTDSNGNIVASYDSNGNLKVGLPASVLTIPENAEIDYVLATLVATDPDGTELTYSIADDVWHYYQDPNNPDMYTGWRFIVVKDGGTWYLKCDVRYMPGDVYDALDYDNPANFESNPNNVPSWTITLCATDKDGQTYYYDVIGEVINDVDEYNPDSISQSDKDFLPNDGDFDLYVKENVEGYPRYNGDIADLTIYDSDNPTNDYHFIYIRNLGDTDVLDAGNGWRFATDLFELDVGKLWLRQGVTLDYEVQNTYTIQLMVLDAGGRSQTGAKWDSATQQWMSWNSGTGTYESGGQPSYMTVTIHVEDVNDAPTDICVVGTNDAGVEVNAHLGNLNPLDNSADRIAVEENLVGANIATLHMDGTTDDDLLRGPDGSYLNYNFEGGDSFDRLPEYHYYQFKNADGSYSKVTLQPNGTYRTVSEDGLFVIEYSSNGSWYQLRVADGAYLDHETKDSYKLWIRVTDREGLTCDRMLWLTVTDVNDQPGFIAPGADLPTQTEDLTATANAGMLVSDFLAASVRDTDDPANSVGLAVYGLYAGNAADRTDGIWQYQAGGVGAWADIDASSLSASTALLLAGTDRVRFVPTVYTDDTPDGAAGTKVWFAYYAWDGTDGKAAHSYTGDISASRQGSLTERLRSAYSETNAVAYLDVINVNDAPVLAVSEVYSLADIEQGTAAGSGQSVTELLLSYSGDAITDVDINPSEGIAIVGLTTSINGQWEYTLDGGANWLAVSGTVSSNNALLLRAGDENVRLRFNALASAGAGADTGGLRFLAWDVTSGHMSGNYIDVASYGTGGASAFSLLSRPGTIAVTINERNIRPELDNSGDMVLTSIEEDVASAANLGNSIYDLIAGAGGNRITDANLGLAKPVVEGIAVVGAASTGGEWQYTIDGGLTWLSLSGASETSAVLLRSDNVTNPGAADANTRVRFVPNADWNGEATGLIFRAWDQTRFYNGQVVDVSAVGFADNSPFSTQTETARILVEGVNDAPSDLTIDNTTLKEYDSSGVGLGSLDGDHVAWLGVTDADQVFGDTFVYALVDDYGGAFALRDNELVVKDASKLDFETQPQVSITVRVTDAGLWGGPPYSFTKTVVLNLTDVYERVNGAPTDVTISPDSVLEYDSTGAGQGSYPGLLVGSLSAADPDNEVGDTHTYELLDSAGGAFKLIGDRIYVDNAMLLDREATESLTITVRVTDAGRFLGTQQSLVDTVTIHLGSVNEYALTDLGVTSISGAGGATSGSVIRGGSVDEATSGARIGGLIATDRDVADTYSYAVIGSNAAYFEVVDGVLKLRNGVSLDVDKQDHYLVTIRATDGGGLGHSIERTLDVKVNDILNWYEHADEAASDLAGVPTGGTWSAGEYLGSDTLTALSSGGLRHGGALALTSAEIGLGSRSSFAFEGSAFDRYADFRQIISELRGGGTEFHRSAELEVELTLGGLRWGDRLVDQAALLPDLGRLRPLLTEYMDRVFAAETGVRQAAMTLEKLVQAQAGRREEEPEGLPVALTKLQEANNEFDLRLRELREAIKVVKSGQVAPDADLQQTREAINAAAAKAESETANEAKAKSKAAPEPQPVH